MSLTHSFHLSVILNHQNKTNCYFIRIVSGSRTISLKEVKGHKSPLVLSGPQTGRINIPTLT